jgi:hypothetical protein
VQSSSLLPHGSGKKTPIGCHTAYAHLRRSGSLPPHRRIWGRENLIRRHLCSRRPPALSCQSTNAEEYHRRQGPPPQLHAPTSRPSLPQPLRPSIGASMGEKRPLPPLVAGWAGGDGAQAEGALWSWRWVCYQDFIPFSCKLAQFNRGTHQIINFWHQINQNM